ncbi:hypothetical protein KAI46_04145 [bacterium]|nr:hypothetical protein [bacterium]
MVDGFSQYVGSAQALGFHATAAWFKVESDRPITGFELFGTANGSHLPLTSSISQIRNW